MKITARTALELASHEGLVRQAYKDSVGVWTWSIGITSASGHNVERYIDTPQPLEHCLEIYVWALQRYADEVTKAFSPIVLNEHQLAGALSFHWNTGSISKATWVKKWLAGDVTGAKKSFMDWKKPAEIIPRRQKERDLFFDGKWSSDGMSLIIPKVRANYAPDFSSGYRADIRPDLEKIFSNKNGSVLPVETKPVINDKPAAKPDEKPAEKNKPSNHIPALVSLAIALGFGLWGWLISLPCKALGLFCGG